MTCEDCYHNEVCYLRIVLNMDYDEMKNEYVADAEKCQYFKDKSLIVELPCKLGQIVYDVVLCDDDIYRIFKMKISKIEPFGSLYEGTNCPAFLWNVFLTDNYSYAYRVFSDIGKKIFFDKSEAETKLKELNNENSI